MSHTLNKLKSKVVTFTGTTGTNEIVVPDNQVEALVVRSGTTAQDYMVFKTTDASESVNIEQNTIIASGKTLTLTSGDLTLTSGNLVVSGNVDGRDVSADGTALDNLVTTIGLSALTSAEVDQLENIGTTTVSATQWGYLGATDQALATTDTVSFANIDGTTQTDGGNIRLTANTVISTDTNGNISLLPNGTGQVLVKADPTAALGVATKAYVDALSNGIDAKQACRAKTAAALPAYTQAGAGVGATLTANANGVLPAVDGVTLVVSDRVLVTDGVDGADNGIYTVTDVGSAGTPWIFTRATDSDADSEVTANIYTFVSEGTLYADSGWVLTSNDPITVDTTTQTFVQYSQAGVIVGANVGGQAGEVFKDKVGNTLNFKTISAGASTILTLANNASDITMDIAQGNITGTGALASGSISSGFGTISTNSTISTTAAVTGLSLTTTATGANTASLALAGGQIVFSTDAAPTAVAADKGALYMKTGASDLFYMDASEVEYNLSSPVTVQTAASTATVTVVSTDGIVNCTHEAGAITVNLPTATTMQGKQLTIVNSSSSQTATVTPATNDFVDDIQNATVSLAETGDRVTLIAVGSKWYTV